MMAPWIGAALLVCIVFATVFVAITETIKFDANNPQIQLATEAADALNGGKEPTDVVSGRVNLGSSLAPFTIVYSKTGKAVAGNGYLDGQLPTVPENLLISSDLSGYHAGIWQPRDGLRFATVVTTSSQYYVLSGRSTLEVDQLISRISLILLTGALLGMIAVVTIILIVRKRA